MTDDHGDEMVLVCANTDCRVAENGRCVEGFQLGECPHYSGNPLAESEGGIASGSQEDGVGAESVQLPGVDAMTPSQASAILRAGKTFVIAILGPFASGKTSLVAGLYDLFQEGPVAGVRFSRSRTLHAFERTCHDARSASRRSEPHMYRTHRGEVRFYHLEIAVKSAAEGLSLILGDRSGEDYQEAADDPAMCTTFSEVARADSLTVLVDGERLLLSGERHNLRSEILLMLQALHDGRALIRGTRLALALTKLDAVQKSPYSERAVRDFDSLYSELCRRFGEVLSAIESFKLAASPKTDTAMRGEGVPDLLQFWLQPAEIPPRPARPIPSLERAFARTLPLDESTE